MVRFLIKCCFILPVFLIVMSVNYFADPGNIFHPGKPEKSIAEYMAQGKNVTNAYNFDDRIMRRFLLNSTHTNPDVVVLSSSRGGFISNNIYPGKKILNNFLRGASLEDYLAIYDIIESKNLKPQKIVITLDPWLLNDNNDAPRWEILEKNYYSMLKKLGIQDTATAKNTAGVKNLEFEKTLQLLSPSYFKQACIYLKKSNTSFYPTTQHKNKELTYMADGSICYDQKRRNLSVSKVDELAIKYINENPVYCLGGFKELSVSRKKLLEAFIDYVKLKGIDVEFYLPPYHPIVYDYLKKNPKYSQVFSAEAYYVDLAKRKDVNCRGSYNPTDCGLYEDSFYDGMHGKETAVEHIFGSSLRYEAHLKLNKKDKIIN